MVVRLGLQHSRRACCRRQNYCLLCLLVTWVSLADYAFYRHSSSLNKKELDIELKLKIQWTSPWGVPQSNTTTIDQSLENSVISLNNDNSIISLNNDTVSAQVTAPKVRFLYGIMSYDHKLETRRRANIRMTYLSFYREFTDTPNRICALVDLIEGGADNPLLEECQLAYTFVMGANPDGPTQLLEFNDSFPLTIERGSYGSDERDITLLNIKENGKFGKSPTWFKYGLTVMENYPHLQFDYIVKTDSDTLLYPHFFFKMVQKRLLRPFPDNTLVYGGSPFDKSMCGFPSHDHCANLAAPMFMGGGFYFLSPDLADYITGPACPRSTLFLPHEDMTTGNYVFSHPKNITLIAEKDGYEKLWRHSVKNPKRLLVFYHSYLQALVKKKLLSQEKVEDWRKIAPEKLPEVAKSGLSTGRKTRKVITGEKKKKKKPVR